ncbi:FkbM family methyltransferase [Pseudooceanicola onchidii]|uniref:FkbM family methyltransferase n=1 Tax=Pseudooceanicola onchidii TaxID=2562279 RepID=UPI001F0E4C80|nr:FkbM family methyltransferase [Pseudooceanicola onchidii]
MTAPVDHSDRFPGSSDPEMRATLARKGQPAHITSHGVQFPTDLPPMVHKTRRLLAEDGYEEKESAAALRIVKAGDRVVELGAGMGYMSSIVSKNCAPAEVHAFEANPALIPCIRRVHSENGITCATLHHALLGPEAGEADFYVRRNFVESSMLPDPAESVVSRHKVPVRPARATIAALAPDVLICDIEGAELMVLPLLDLSRLRAAIVELHPQYIGLPGVQVIFDAMNAGGLIYNPRRSNGKVVTFSRPQ